MKSSQGRFQHLAGRRSRPKEDGIGEATMSDLASKIIKGQFVSNNAATESEKNIPESCAFSREVRILILSLIQT